MRLLAILLSLACLVPTQLIAQELPPRLTWGDPDLQGIWFYHTLTPLERPEVFATTDVLTPDAEAEYVKQQHTNLENAELRGDWGARAVLTDSRTAQIIDPVNGRVPPRTPAAQRRAETIGSSPSSRTADGPEDRESLERCIMGRSVPFLARSFEQRVQIFQTRHYVALKDEFGELRLVPLDGRERLPESIRQWGGRSRGQWDGDTLVVETTNFNGQWSLRGSGSHMRLVERFVWSAPGTLDYEFTVDDPQSFESAWTATFPFVRDPGPLHDYACHEGNRSMPLILGGARAEERMKRDDLP